MVDGFNDDINTLLTFVRIVVYLSYPPINADDMVSTGWSLFGSSDCVRHRIVPGPLGGQHTDNRRPTALSIRPDGKPLPSVGIPGPSIPREPPDSLDQQSMVPQSHSEPLLRSLWHDYQAMAPRIHGMDHYVIYASRHPLPPPDAL